MDAAAGPLAGRGEGTTRAERSQAAASALGVRPFGHPHEQARPGTRQRFSRGARQPRGGRRRQGRLVDPSSPGGIDDRSAAGVYRLSRSLHPCGGGSRPNWRSSVPGRATKPGPGGAGVGAEQARTEADPAPPGPAALAMLLIEGPPPEKPDEAALELCKEFLAMTKHSRHKKTPMWRSPATKLSGCFEPRVCWKMASRDGLPVFRPARASNCSGSCRSAMISASALPPSRRPRRGGRRRG